MKKSKNKLLLLLLFGSFLAPVSYSAEIDWSGFVSIVAGTTLDEEKTYDIGSFGQSGTIYDDKLSFEPDSLFALQGTVPVNDKTRATVQIVARAGEEMNAEFEWAYLSYDLTENWDVNAGKFRLSLYNFSDFLDVGYAYYWIRPPAEAYIAPSAMLGVNTNYTGYVGDVDYRLHGWYGSDNIGTVDIYNNWGVYLSASYNWMNFRVVYHETGFENSLFGLEQNIAQVGYAFNVDYQNFMFRSEYTLIDIEFITDGFQRTWYTSFGYNFNGITPHFTYMDVEDTDSQVMTYGVSYDVSINAKLKAEYSMSESDSGMDTELLSFGIDMVF